MKLSIKFLTLTIAMTALTISHAKLGDIGMRHLQFLQSGDCEICSQDNRNKPDFIILEYIPQGVNSRFQDSSKATCVAGFYPDQTTISVKNKDGNTQSVPVEANTVFTINGPFDAETDFYFANNNNDECYIHTSCSVPLVAGDQIGPFKVLAGTGCGPFDPVVCAPGTDCGTCEICSKDNKDKPDRLKLMYKSDGKDSRYQDASKATCRSGSYPEATTIVTTNKDKNTDVVEVEDGTVFEIQGQFNAETEFTFLNGLSCYIHTSCSVPLVAGDQIGPFFVLEGNECIYKTSEPSTPPSPSPSAPPSPSPSAPPSTPPTPAPSPSPSAPPSKRTCIETDKEQYNPLEDIVVYYNPNEDEDKPIEDGVVCIYPEDVTCPAVILQCANPLPENCAKIDGTGEITMPPQMPFVDMNQITRRRFFAVLFRTLDDGVTIEKVCCSDIFQVGVEQVCLAAASIHVATVN